MQGTNRRIFEHRLRQLLAVTVERQGNAEVSFVSGFWEKEEGYKREIVKNAQAKLSLDEWDELSDEGIIAKVYGAIYDVVGDDNKQQNLVSKENAVNVLRAFKENGRTKSKTRMSEAVALFRTLYQEKDFAETIVFDGIARMLTEAGVYDAMSVTAYLFFIKNPRKYITVRKNGYRERLPKLDISTDCVKTCSWGNYHFLLSQVEVIKGYLAEYFADVELIDAQSFLWMMWLIDGKTPEYDIGKCVLK